MAEKLHNPALFSALNVLGTVIAEDILRCRDSLSKVYITAADLEHFPGQNANSPTLEDVEELTADLQDFVRITDYSILSSLDKDEIKGHLSVIPGFWEKGHMDSLLDDIPHAERTALKKLFQTTYSFLADIGLRTYEPALQRQQPQKPNLPGNSRKPSGRKNHKNKSLGSRATTNPSQNLIFHGDGSKSFPAGNYPIIRLAEGARITILGDLESANIEISDTAQLKVLGNTQSVNVKVSDRARLTVREGILKSETVEAKRFALMVISGFVICTETLTTDGNARVLSGKDLYAKALYLRGFSEISVNSIHPNTQIKERSRFVTLREKRRPSRLPNSPRDLRSQGNRQNFRKRN